ILYYLKLTFSPYPLVLDYGARIVQDPTQIAVCASILALLIAGTLAAFWRHSWIGFLGSAFFLILAPSSSFVPVLTQTLAEHRMYLPLASVVALSVLLCFLGWERLAARRHEEAPSPLVQHMLPGLLICVVSLLGVQTWLRNL